MLSLRELTEKERFDYTENIYFRMLSTPIKPVQMLSKSHRGSIGEITQHILQSTNLWISIPKLRKIHENIFQVNWNNVAFIL